MSGEASRPYETRVQFSRLEFEFVEQAMQAEGWPGLFYEYCRHVLIRHAAYVDAQQDAADPRLPGF